MFKKCVFYYKIIYLAFVFDYKCYFYNLCLLKKVRIYNK